MAASWTRGSWLETGMWEITPESASVDLSRCSCSQARPLGRKTPIPDFWRSRICTGKRHSIHIASIDCEFPTSCLVRSCGTGQCAACPKSSVCGQAPGPLTKSTISDTCGGRFARVILGKASNDSLSSAVAAVGVAKAYRDGLQSHLYGVIGIRRL